MLGEYSCKNQCCFIVIYRKRKLIWDGPKWEIKNRIRDEGRNIFSVHKICFHLLICLFTKFVLIPKIETITLSSSSNQHLINIIFIWLYAQTITIYIHTDFTIPNNNFLFSFYPYIIYFIHLCLFQWEHIS